MVRLRARSICKSNAATQFQFHNGSIERRTNKGCFMNVYHFNSTMVRLRVKGATSINVQPINFNSTMLRLRVNVLLAANGHLSHFNSTMVRLRVYFLARGAAYYNYFNSTMVRLRDIRFFIVI